MEEIGIRDLKQRVSEILRQVREEHENFSVTYRGKVVAKLVPAMDPSADQEVASAIWIRMDDLSREVSARLPTESSESEAASEQRPEL